MNKLYIVQGEGIKHISKSAVKGITIPIHSLEKQNEIVEYCECNENNIRQLEKEIEENKARIGEYIKGL